MKKSVMMNIEIGKKIDKKNKDIYSMVTFLVMYIYQVFVLWGQYTLYDQLFPTLPILLGILLIPVFTTKIILKFAAGWNLEVDANVDNKKVIKLATIVFVVTVILLGIVFYARYPGIFYVDSEDQLGQVINNSYGDWHCFVHTFLAFTIPYKLLGVCWIVPIQLLFYCIAITYMISSLRKYGCPLKLCVFIYCYIMMQPDTLYILLFPMKDCAFAILTMLLMTELMNIVCTKGEWIKKNYNLLLLVITCTVCTFVRHNGILFTAPIMLAVFFYTRRYVKRYIGTVIGIVVFSILIKGPFFKAYNIGETPYRLTEITGMCMVMMGNAYIEAPYMMPEEAKNFIEDIKEREVWEEFYELGDWNYVKWYDKTTVFEAMEKYSLKDVLGYTAQTIATCPDQCIKAFFAVTGMAWQIDGERRWSNVLRTYMSNHDFPPVTEKDPLYEVVQNTVELPLSEDIKEIQNIYMDVMSYGIFEYIFCYCGILNLLLLIIASSKVRAKKSFAYYLMILPIMIYSYGTALLLSTYDIRYFYYTYACFFISAFLMLGKTKEERNYCEL